MRRSSSRRRFPAEVLALGRRFPAEVLALGGAVLLACPDASAQTRDPAAAEALFDAGRAALQAKDYDAACPKFRESYELDPAPGALLNLADCEEKRGKVATAWSIFRQLARDLPASDDRRPIAQARATALEGRVPRLTIRLAPGAPAGTAVQRGDIPVGAGSLGAPLPVDPGEIQVTASAPGRAQKTFTVQLAEGAQAELLVAPEAPAAVEDAGPALPPKHDEAATASSPRRTAGWISAGAGVVGIGVGAVFGLRAIGKKGDATAYCNEANVCSAEGIRLQKQGATAGTISTVAFLVGAAALGAGAVLVFTAPSSGPASSAPRATLGVVPGGAVATVVF
ncbi:tetratricopeptide repeat protein [Sorangium sp. So ce1024]|uniref:tetratricopeptide repeat protein n=1 Tax=Sorangium sp. So ce1024 TaxID=3133327 RepID=UPI003EFBDE6E